MADIFSGNSIKVELGTAGAAASTTFEVIPEVAVFPTTGAENTTIDVKTFNSPYNRVLLGTRKQSEIALSVNWIFDNAVHAKLLAASENQTRIQLRVSYMETSAANSASYVTVLNGYISKNGVTGDKDSVVVQEFTFLPDGKPVSAAPVAGK